MKSLHEQPCHHQMTRKVNYLLYNGINNSIQYLLSFIIRVQPEVLGQKIKCNNIFHCYVCFHQSIIVLVVIQLPSSSGVIILTKNIFYIKLYRILRSMCDDVKVTRTSIEWKMIFKNWKLQVSILQCTSLETTSI